MRVARIERRPVLEHKRGVTFWRLRLPKRSWLNFPVRMIHGEVAARVVASAALEQEHTHAGLGQRHRRKAAAGSRADDHDVELLCFRRAHGRRVRVWAGGSAYSG